jgi:hypothetical protein
MSTIIEAASLARRAVVETLGADPTLMSRVKKVYGYNPPGKPDQPFLVVYPLRAVNNSPLSDAEGGVEISLSVQAVWGHYEVEDDAHPVIEALNRIYELLDGAVLDIPGCDPTQWSWLEMDEEQDADSLGFDGSLTFTCQLLRAEEEES